MKCKYCNEEFEMDREDLILYSARGYMTPLWCSRMFGISRKDVIKAGFNPWDKTNILCPDCAENLIESKKSFEKGDRVSVRNTERKGTVTGRKGDFYNVTLDSTGEKKEKGVFVDDLVKACMIKSAKKSLVEKYVITTAKLIKEMENEEPSDDRASRLNDKLDELYDLLCGQNNPNVVFDESNRKYTVDGKGVEEYVRGLIGDGYFDDERNWKKLTDNIILNIRDFATHKVAASRKTGNRAKAVNSGFITDSTGKFSLSEIAQYLSSLFFDLRTIHFKCTGSEFYTYHELAEDLYEKTESYYDDIVETAITYDSNIQPMFVLPGDWNSVDSNGSFSTDSQAVQKMILERLERIYDILLNIHGYDSMVQSKIDGMLEYYNKEIYKLTQALR